MWNRDSADPIDENIIWKNLRGYAMLAGAMTG